MGYNKELKQYRIDLQQRVLDIPASLCTEIYHDFIVRGDNSIITWNKTMIEDEGFLLDRLRDLTVILENRAEAIGLTSKVIKT